MHLSLGEEKAGKEPQDLRQIFYKANVLHLAAFPLPCILQQVSLQASEHKNTVKPEFAA